MDDFLEWMNSEEGQEAEMAISLVHDFLEKAIVDVDEQKIILDDGKKLSIPETAQMIFNNSEKISFNSIKRQIINWLEMDYVPIGLNEDEMVIFETKIDEWAKV